MTWQICSYYVLNAIGRRQQRIGGYGNKMSIHKRMACNKGCGVLIHFDDSHVSQSGKKIPLEDDGEPHQCPNSQYNKEGPAPKAGAGSEFSELKFAVERLTQRIEELIQRMDQR